jgi:hypothetical protein
MEADMAAAAKDEPSRFSKLVSSIANAFSWGKKEEAELKVKDVE